MISLQLRALKHNLKASKINELHHNSNHLINSACFAGLGQQVDGTLADYLVFPIHTLAKVPAHLSWEEVCFSVAS